MDKLLETGWQSWSWDKKSFLKLPTCNYSPKNMTNVPDIPACDPKSFVSTAPKELKKPVNGWCSWYAFGTDIDEQKIDANIDLLMQNKLSKFNHILIDDGWEPHWGDWLGVDASKFPSGLPAFAKSIADRNLVAGIWFAPFLASPNSTLFKTHPDWFVRHKGKLIDGMRLSPFDTYFKHKKYILDIKNPSVIIYLDSVLVHLIETCGFKLLKLDFLYGTYFDPRLTTSEADSFLRQFLLKIKTKYPNVYTIACGCPLIPAVGVVDSMRIGPDINIPSLINTPIIGKFLSKFLYKKVIKNINLRNWTKTFWNLDPDVLFG